MTSTVWSIEVRLTEDAEATHAEAVLEVGDREFRGAGKARRNPADPDIPRIGEELATARALSELSHKLLHAAVAAIEAFEGHRVKVHD
jgi:hypothetical protein